MRRKMNLSVKTWMLGVFAAGALGISHASSAACLEKQRVANGGVRADIFMIAPESEVTLYASLGFHRAACPADLSVVRQYVDRICSGAPQGKFPPLDTENAIGRSRTLACASAKAGLAEAGG